LAGSFVVPRQLQLSNPANPGHVSWQARLVSAFNAVDRWPKDFFETTYSAHSFLGTVYHHLRDPADVKQVLLDNADAFQKSPLHSTLLKPLLGKGLITSEDPRWTAQNRAISPAFRKDALRCMAPKIAVTAGTLARELAARTALGPIDVAPLMSAAAFATIASCLLGARENHLRKEAIAKALNDYARCLDDPKASLAQDAVATLHQCCQEVLAARPVDSTAEDANFLDCLAREAASPEQALDPEEIRDNIVTFLVAGHETTAMALTWSLFLVARDQRVQDQLAEEVWRICGRKPIEYDDLPRLRLLQSAIREALRLFPPVAVLSRVAARDVEFGHFKILEGQVANIPIYALHRHKLHWSEPNEFHLLRFTDDRQTGMHKFAYLPFGGGRRVCTGARLATMEIAILLGSMLREVRFFCDPDYQPRPIAKITLRPKEGMLLNLKPRNI
jgi:cytochrome P450